MQEELLLLISLIEERLLKIQKQLDQRELDNNSIYSKEKDRIKELKKNKNVLVDIDLQRIELLLNELQITDQEDLLQSIEIIQVLLKMNRDKHTTYKITESQLESVNRLLEKIEEYEQEQEKELTQAIKEKKEYQKLLNRIIKKQEPITELTIINNLFNDLSITEETQSRILLGLMKYNKELYSPNEFLIPEWDM